MKISKIEVKNFRSLLAANIPCADFNVFVGQNNCGKTNLFEALEWFYKGPGKGIESKSLKWKQLDENEIVVTVYFSGAQEGAKKMVNESNRTKILNALGGADEVAVRRSSVEEKKREVLVAGVPVKTGTGFDSALNDFLPKFEYIHTKQYYDSVAKFAKTTPIGIMLSGVLGAILETNEQYKAFQTKFRELFENDDSAVRKEFNVLAGSVQVNLAKQFPDCASVKFEVQLPEFEDLLKNFDTRIDDGIETTAEEKGDGMQRALMLAIIQTYAEYRKKGADVGKSFLFFIDEAELHLHPSAQRKLKNVLQELTEEGDQVFMNTHSSVFIADDHAKQSLFMVEKGDDGDTDISEIEPHEKAYVVYELLGGSPADLLLPRNFLIVEGPAEVEFLTQSMQRLCAEKPAIQFIPANGDHDQAERSINAIEKVFTPLSMSLYKERMVVMIDKPRPEKQAGVDEFVAARGELKDSGRFLTLPVGSLEEYYPNHLDWRRTADRVANMKGKQKLKLARRVGKAITLEQLKADMPIVWTALERSWALAY